MTRSYSAAGVRMLRSLITHGHANKVKLDSKWFTATMIQQLNDAGSSWLRYNKLANGIIVTREGLQLYRDSKNDQ